MAERMLATEKVWLTNLETLEERDMQFNPTELSHSASAEYTLFTAVGLPHQPHQYSHTTNREWTMTLQFKVESPQERIDVDSTLAFLCALTHPLAQGAAPPSVLLTWPNLATTIVKVRNVAMKHTQFNADLGHTRTDVDLTLMTIRDRPRLYGDVRDTWLME